jgi:predicted regulator of Ras-like GTPase activity (Roadblock/LC7/MglB family)
LLGVKEVPAVAEEVSTNGRLSQGANTIDDVLFGLLRYREVLGAVTISCEGLVVGSAGISPQDADMVGALGAALVGAADRSARRLGAGAVREFSMGTDSGMVHLRNGGEFAVLLFTERCDAVAATALCDQAVREVGRFLT